MKVNLMKMEISLEKGN